MLTLTLNKGAVICTFATQSVRTTHVRRKQMWISLSYIDPSNRNKKHRLWNKAPYVCLWLLVSFLYSYLLTDYITWGWISAFFFNLLQGTARTGAAPWTDWEMSHSYSIILGLPVAGVRGNTRQQISSTNYFLHSGSRSKAPGSPGRDPLCPFWFLTREVGLLVLQHAIQTINDVPLFLCRDGPADS